MYCDNCGCELGENVRKCPVCGKEFPLIEPEVDDSTTVLTSEPDVDEDDDSTTVLTGGTQGMPQMMQQPQGNPVPPQQPQMGMPQPQKMPQEGADIMIKKKGEKKGMSKGAKAALIAIPVVIVIAIGVFAFIFVPKFRKYNEANDLMDQGKVEEAVTLYKDLGKFKDSYTKANGDAYYEYAEGLEKEGKNLEAAEYYKKSGNSRKAAENYSKSSDGDEESFSSDDAFDKAYQCYYNAGMDQMNAASYDAAIDAFNNAGSYKDASDKVIECTYKKAEALITAKKYDDAISILSTIEEYSDSQTLLAKCYYNKASELLDGGKYDDAYDMYMKSEFDDYKNKASECTYKKAEQYYKNKDYENAIKSYDKVDKDYKDCVAEKDKCYQALGTQAYKDKEYKKSVDYYEKVVKTDVSKKIANGKLAFANANKNAANETTMTYLGELRYDGNEKAQKLYSELVKWNIESFVNSSEKDLDKGSNSIKTKDGSDIYIHTSFGFDGDDSMKISGYVVYADGNKSDVITFSDPVVDGWSTWVKISGDSAPKGVTYLYLQNETTKKIIEVYPFTIK